MNRVELDQVADLLERLLVAFEVGESPTPQDVRLAQEAIRDFRAPPTADELQEMCQFTDTVRRAAVDLRLQRN